MPPGANVHALLGKKIVGGVLFTLTYIVSLISFHEFLNKHPEARNPILMLLGLTTLVFISGIIILAKYYK